MWQAWVNGVLGVWLFVAAFLNFTPKFNLWDDLIIGVIATVVGTSMIYKKPWQGWSIGFIGLWLIVAAFIPSLQFHSGNLWNGIVSGVLLMIGGFSALLGHSHSVTNSHAHAY